MKSKFPDFGLNNVKIWFILVESLFVTENVTAETKYHIVGTLDSEMADLICDFITRSLSKTPYIDLKLRLISEFGKSEGKNIKIQVD